MDEAYSYVFHQWNKGSFSPPYYIWCRQASFMGGALLVAKWMSSFALLADSWTLTVEFLASGKSTASIYIGSLAERNQ
eukprot:m.188519 g.188519  ORF g.188519 m.188519 type:complete len:78 (+) comp39387_c0_seq3:220-453(+)